MQGEIEALGNIVLEQELDPTDTRALRIGVGLDRPFPRRRAWQQRYRVRAPAESLVGERRALIFDPVRPLDDQRQRQAGFRLALRVAQQRRGEHGFAGAVDAALGKEKRVESPRRVAAGDAAIGEIEGVLSEAEKAVVVAQRRSEKARRRAAFAARQARIEIDTALGVRRLCRQHFVVARDEPELDAGERRGGAQRLHDCVHPVFAGNRGQTKVGDDHPLRGELHGLARVRIGGLRRALPRARGDDVDAGLELADCVEHGKVGDDVLVERGGDVHRPAPDLGAVLGGDLLGARESMGLRKSSRLTVASRLRSPTR